MADYTMELRELLDYYDDIGLCGYPIFDEEYRQCLNHKIIQHFWNREIGFETASLFIFHLRARMNEIMPLYNQHYLASQKQFDPLKTISIQTVSNSEGESTVTGEGTNGTISDAESRSVASTFPQMQLSPDKDYASNAQDNISKTVANGTSTESQNSSNSGNVESETSGYQGNPAILIAEYRATFVNTDMDVIARLEDLFMGLWGTSDSHFEGSRLQYGYFGYSRVGF